MTLIEAIRVTRERRDWLTHHIEGKLKMDPPWDVAYDRRERDAHSVILAALTEHQTAA